MSLTRFNQLLTPIPPAPLTPPRPSLKTPFLQEYHRDGSSSRYLADVRCPLLCINALDDPICQSALFPLEQARCNPYVIFVSTAAGGHIGFGEGFNPWGRWDARRGLARPGTARRVVAAVYVSCRESVPATVPPLV